MTTTNKERKMRKEQENAPAVLNIANTANEATTTANEENPTPTTEEQLYKGHTDSDGIVTLTGETFHNLSADSERLYKYEDFRFSVLEKLTGHGSGKKTVYSGRLYKGDDDNTGEAFSKLDITALKAACGCTYKRFYNNSLQGGWLVINESAIETVANEKAEKFGRALAGVFGLLTEVGTEWATEEKQSQLIEEYKENARKYAKQVLLTHEANKKEREERREAESKQSKALKALQGLSPEQLAQVIAMLGKQE